MSGQAAASLQLFRVTGTPVVHDSDDRGFTLANRHSGRYADGHAIPRDGVARPTP